MPVYQVDASLATGSNVTLASVSPTLANLTAAWAGVRNTVREIRTPVEVRIGAPFGLASIAPT